jgi:hypothetical protein
MRTILLSVMAIMSGCASTTVNRRVHDGPCLVAAPARGSKYSAPDDGWVVRGGRRVPDDDLVAATADVDQSADLAWHAERDKRAGIGAFLVGGLLLAPGVGLIGYGVDKSQPGSAGVGGALTAVGVAGIVTGVVYLSRADNERDRAIASYNAAHAYGCTASR